MKDFFSIFTRNWGLKLLSLILAIVVFYAVRDSLASSRWHGNTPSFMKGPADAAHAR